MAPRKASPQKDVNKSANNSESNDAPRIRLLKVASLQPHPRQAELVGDMPPSRFEAFAADIAAKGVQNALVLMADGQTIVCGHQRARAAKAHGIAKVPCIIRPDLHDPDDPAVIALLLGDNLHRRQLGPLEKARYAKKLTEIESARRNDPDFPWIDNERQIAVRDAVGKLLACSGRNAARYVAILSAPSEVQRAFEAGLLSLALAAQIAFLKYEIQQKLASSIEKMRSKTPSPKVKQEIQALVRTALRNARPPKRILPPSPSRPLHELKVFLDAQLDVVQASKATIIQYLRAEEFEPDIEELNPGSADLAYAATIKSFRRQILPELRERCSSLAGTLDEIANAIEPASDEANGDGSSSDTVSD